MTTETYELVLQAQALQKENITEKVLAALEARYNGLKINGPDDKTGLKLVHDARMECRSLRILAGKICKAGREEAVAEQRRWLTAEKLVTTRIEAVEKPLQLEEERIAAEIARIRKEKAEAEARMISDRTNAANAVGWAISFDECKSMKEQDFSNELYRRRQQYEAEQEAARIETARRVAEQAERDRLAAEERVRIEAQQAELRRQAEELAERERAIRAAEDDARREAQRIEQEKRHAAELEEAKKLAAEKAAAEEKWRAEQAEREKANAEAKRIALEKQEQEAAELKAAQAPDREKLLDFADTLAGMKLPEMATKVGRDVADNVYTLLAKVDNYIRRQAGNL